MLPRSLFGASDFCAVAMTAAATMAKMMRQQMLRRLQNPRKAGLRDFACMRTELHRLRAALVIEVMVQTVSQVHYTSYPLRVLSCKQLCQLAVLAVLEQLFVNEPTQFAGLQCANMGIGGTWRDWCCS